MKNGFTASSSRGSALLIVLGFLSFMMISAVSFAIYMRIERQATSNYRHTLVARHLLGSALTRAIAEVDVDLDKDYQNTARDKEGDLWRFPSHSVNWEGTGRRTFLSVSDSTNEFARVVSYDSLGYVPALFMNELRFLNDTRSTSPHANWVQFSAPAERVRDESVNNGIPTFYFGGSNVVGRYAFACLNISDLFNINSCTNLQVRDTAANRVSVASAFNASASSELETRLQADLYYSTVLDFYAGMHEGDLPVFPNSPYHKRNAGQRNSALANATNHILVTDGFARVQRPRIRGTRVPNEKACNIRLDETADAVVSGTWNEKLKTAMNGALPEWINFKGSDNQDAIFPIILADYLAEPGAAMTRMDIPSVKMAPMVYQITLSRMDPKTTVETEGVAPNQRRVCYVWPVGDSGGFVEVGLMFPFRNSDALANRTFTVDAEVNIYLLDGDPSPAEAPEILSGMPLFCPTITSSKTVTVPSSIPNQQQCFLSTAIPISAVNKIALTAYDGSNKRVVFVVFVTVRQGGNYFDSVPHVNGQNPAGSVTADRGKIAVPKLYFQQAASFLVSDALSDRSWPLEYYSLKCPDPRYNFSIANWYVSASPSIDGAAMLDELRAANLLGSSGRDSDIFMFASGQKVLQSPGELGFLVHPYNNSSSVSKYTSFSEALKNRTITQLTDYDAFYRTVRLYDHGGYGGQSRDPIYEWFYAANEDESVDGACVNPHSDLPPVLSAAISKTPLDYYYAYQNRTSVAYKQKTFDSPSYGLAASDWSRFAAAWLKQFRLNQQYLKDVNQRYDNKFLFEIYGDSVSPYQWAWYSGNPRDIFNVSLSGNLFEVDRKMLYSFSLESFSDRQQLFLYILQAEATGSIVGSSSKSSAGGRAVAVVWRDPDLNQNINPKRHDTRILYFKQLDN